MGTACAIPLEHFMGGAMGLQVSFGLAASAVALKVLLALDIRKLPLIWPGSCPLEMPINPVHGGH